MSERCRIEARLGEETASEEGLLLRATAPLEKEAVVGGVLVAHVSMGRGAPRHSAATDSYTLRGGASRGEGGGEGTDLPYKRRAATTCSSPLNLC